MAVNSTAWKSMTIADRDQPFDADDAIVRLAERAKVGGGGGSAKEFYRGFLWRNDQGDPLSRESYRLPQADVFNGELQLVPHAIYAAAALLSGAHGGLPNVPDEDKEQIRDVISEIYIKLRDTYNDPRIRPPWDRGRPPEERSDAQMTYVYPATSTTNPTTVTITVTPFAEDPLKPYGDVTYADPGYQEDGKKRYPIDTEDHVRAAWSYINQGDNADKYSSDQLDKIKSKIKSAAKKYGINISDEMSLSDFHMGEIHNDDVDIEVTEDECPEGQHMMPDGTCMDDEDMEEEDEDTGYSLLSSGQVKPFRAWFDDPKLTEPTPLTVTDTGYVYGHLAKWGECHTGIGNACVTAPHSNTDYAYFKTGQVVCDNGDLVPIGKITLGTGHADPQWGYVPATGHYDSSAACIAVVNVGEDDHGIWVAGSLVPGVSTERIAELRRSPLSGDWRRIGGNLELIAALGVNVPGFPVVRAAAGFQQTLLAAGIIEKNVPPVVINFDIEAQEVADRLTRFQALVDKLDRAERNRRLARILEG